MRDFRVAQVMSQCNRATSSPNTEIARAPTEPTTWSSSGAIASNARAIRSSLSAQVVIPNVSATAHSRAHSATRTIGAGLVNRFATSASITCPWVKIGTSSRIGHARSMIPTRSSRRLNSATTGNDPNILSTLDGPYTARCPRMAPV